MKKKILIGAVISTLTVAGVAYAISKNPRANEIVEFNKGHYHNLEGTHGAPEHSGGTDAYGCHNGSVPYHCH